MAELKDPRKGVKSEGIVFHDADGYPVENKDDAVSAEITTEYEDGRQEVTILNRRV